MGSAVLEVAQPRQPCFKLGIRMADDGFPRRFASAGHPGVYLRIINEGAVAAGDVIDVQPAEQPAVAIRSLVGDDIPARVLRHAANDPRVPAGLATGSCARRLPFARHVQ